MFPSCGTVGVTALVLFGQFLRVLPLEQAPEIPKEVVITNAPWEEVRENQELYAREFDLWVKRQEPALAQRGANYTKETDKALRKDIDDADLRSNLAVPEIERRAAALMHRYTEPYEQGQILYKKACELALAHADEETRATVADALKLPLWPDQRCELHRVSGQLILKEYGRSLGAGRWGEDPAFREVRHAYAKECLRGARVAHDCAFPKNLPDLQLHNMLESRIVPNDPAEMQAMREANAHREMVETKALKFLELIHDTVTLGTQLEADVVAQYALGPSDSEELAALAAEILHDPQEEAKLMEMLKAKADEQSAP
jgi:hypothetical protein